MNRPSLYVLRDSHRTSKKKYGKYGYGGNNRTQQIGALIERAGFDIVDIPQEVETTRQERFYHGLRCWWNFGRKGYRLRFPDEYKPSPTGYRYLRYAKTFRRYPDAAFLLQEEPPHFESYHAAKDISLPIIALPHNLETIHNGGYPEVLRGVSPTYSLPNEVKHLAQTDRCICISREEQWLLNNCGVKTDFLPYYPVKNKKENLKEIFYNRQNVYKDEHKFLVIGSVHNPPAYEGVITLIKKLQEIWSEKKSFHVDIAGYGTSRIKKLIHCTSGFSVHGTVSPNKLYDLQSQATAQIVHQTYGLGALTRIPEALVAGLPVIANAHAARSAYDLDGVHVYQNTSELSDLIEKPLPTPPSLGPPKNAEYRFIRFIRTIAGLSASPFAVGPAT